MEKRFKMACIMSFLIFIGICVGGQAMAQKEEPLKIAILGPMTHVSGKYTTWATEMAAEEINSAGGVAVGGGKRPLKLMVVDTNELRSVPDAASAVERAINADKVDFLIGSWRSEAVLAMMDIAMDYKKIMITEGAHVGISKRVKDNYDRYKYWFRAYSNTEEGIPNFLIPIETMVPLVRKELKIEKPKVATIIENVLWTEPFIKASQEKIPKVGGEFVGLWRPSPHATDMSAELLAIKNKGAHLIWVANWSPSGLVLTKQWDELKIPVVLMGGIGELTYSTFWQSSGGLGNYSITWNTISRVKINETTIPFWDKYVKKTGAWPDIFSANFYAAVYRLKLAIEKAGKLDPDAIVTAMEKLIYDGPAGRYEVYGMDSKYPHDPKVTPYYCGTICQWQSGKLETIFPPRDGSFHGLVYDGVVEPKLPPWMVNYWKGKK